MEIIIYSYFSFLKMVLLSQVAIHSKWIIPVFMNLPLDKREFIDFNMYLHTLVPDLLRLTQETQLLLFRVFYTTPDVAEVWIL